MKYFAYGSNMSLIRLRERAPNVERVGTFLLVGHQLCFHKASDDGSGKCDVVNTNNRSDIVIGALFDINKFEKSELDKVEGLGYGYDEKTVTVHNESGESFEALTYYAIKTDPSLKPYSWYLNHVLIGAKEIVAETEYLNKLESTECIDDPNIDRDAKQRLMYG